MGAVIVGSPPVGGEDPGGDPTWPVPGTPATFPPSAHAHPQSDISGLTDTLASKETPAGAQAKAEAARSSAVTTAASDASTKVGVETSRALAAEGTRVARSGDTMTGPLLLSGDPTNALGAATRQWVLARVAELVGAAPAELDTFAEAFARFTSDESALTALAGVVSGKQPLDDDLTALAGLVTTATGRSLLTIADAAAGRSILAAASQAALTAHVTDTSNPHGTTKAQVGLGAVDNVSAANLRDRATHTGEAPISSVTGLTLALSGKASTADLLLVGDEGGVLTRRGTLNFIGDGVTAVDNPTTGSTDVTIPGGGTGGGDGTGGGFPMSVANASVGEFALGQQDFLTVPLGVSEVDPGENYDPTTYLYTVRTAGIYLVLARVRVPDDAAATHFGMGVHTSNGDGPFFQWQTSYGQRYTANYQRLARFNAGDQLRLFIYRQNGATSFKSAALDVLMVA